MTRSSCPWSVIARRSLGQHGVERDSRFDKQWGMRKLFLIAVLACAALVAAGCGEKKETDAPGTFGPGVKATDPPWKPEYAHLPERMRMNHIPPPGNQK